MPRMQAVGGVIHFENHAADRELARRVGDAMTIFEPELRGEAATTGGAMVWLARDDRNAAAPPLQPWPLAGGGLLVADATLENRETLATAFGWNATEAAERSDGAFTREAFLRWGDQCVDRLEGRFALAAWLPGEGRLFLAVDPLGKRPLYWHRRSGRLVFATTLRGVFAAPGVSRELNEEVFVDAFTGCRRVNEATLYREISRVPGGHRVWITAGGARVGRYWNPQPDPAMERLSDKACIEAFREEFVGAVRRSLRGAGKAGDRAGILLSGGLDSAAVAVTAGRLLAEQGSQLEAVHLLAASGESRYRAPLREWDESPYVRALEAAGAPGIAFHYHKPVQTEPAPPAEWADFFAMNQVPFAGLPPATKPDTRFWDELGLGVVLNGLGGNFLVSPESMASGWPGHLAVSGRWGRLALELAGLHRFYGLGWRNLAGDTLRQAGWRKEPDRHTRPWTFQLLSPELLRRTGAWERHLESEAEWVRLARRDPRGRLRRLLTETMAQNLGAASSVLIRGRQIRSASPMFDVRFNTFCLSLPLERQMRNGTDRRLLREAVRGWLPDALRLRPTRGLPQPQFQTGFTQLLPTVLSTLETDTDHAWFDRQACRTLKAQLETQQKGHAHESAAMKVCAWRTFNRWNATEA